MGPFIVVTDGMDQEHFKVLQQDPSFQVHPQRQVRPAQLKELLPRTQALVVRSATSPDRELIDLAPQLQYIIRAGEGTDHIDKAYCQEKRIKVSNTPGANNNSAAEHAVALMMSTLRHIPSADQSMKSGKWEKSHFVGLELWQKRVGIVGLGRIGQIVAKRLQGFEVEVLYFDPVMARSPLDFCHQAENLKDIFSQCDIITLHTPLTKTTQNLITKDLLKLMGPQSILINASRGKIVNEDDLYTALKAKKIRGAAFDVFATEPLPKNSPLRTLDNFVMTPHLGASTDEAQKRVGEMVVKQLREFFHHNIVLNQVCPS